MPPIPQKERSSNLELYRIIVMLLIVAHHYVANSGLLDVMRQEPLSANSVFYYLFGMWGKTGINCFVLITGYFMCTSNITWRKVFKLLQWIMTYKIVIGLIFWISGYETLTLKNVLIQLRPIGDISNGFTTAFILFYLFIPFLNVMIRGLDRKKHLLLILLSVAIYSIWYIVPHIRVEYNYVIWFGVLYVISAYIRLHPNSIPYCDSARFWGMTAALSSILAMGSVVATLFIGDYFSKERLINKCMWLVSDSNAPLALLVGVTSFMFFKNLKIKNSKAINTIAASAFGVLLIHANGNSMRHWLWKDVVDCTGHYAISYFWIYAIACVILIYLVCFAIDWVRMHTIEKVVMHVGK